MSTELGQVIGVLLDPPRFGHVVVEELGDQESSIFEGWWFAGDDRRHRLPRWRVEEPDGLVYVCQDGHRRLFADGALLEEVVDPGGRPPPALHLVFPMASFIWGRPVDDWRMRDDIAELADGLVRVPLTYQEDPVWEGHLIVDMRRRLWVEYNRPGKVQRINRYDAIHPQVAFDSP